MTEDRVEGILDNWHEADLNPRMRSALTLLEKLTLAPEDVGPEDVAPLRAAGVDDDGIRDVIYICAYFNLMDRVADALDFEVPELKARRSAAQKLWRWGYRA